MEQEQWIQLKMLFWLGYNLKIAIGGEKDWPLVRGDKNLVGEIHWGRDEQILGWWGRDPQTSSRENPVYEFTTVSQSVS